METASKAALIFGLERVINRIAAVVLDRDGTERVKGERARVFPKHLGRTPGANPILFFAGAPAIIAALTFGAVAYQADQTMRATEAMERSTGALIQIERGRLITYWNEDSSCVSPVKPSKNVTVA